VAKESTASCGTSTASSWRGHIHGGAPCRVMFSSVCSVAIRMTVEHRQTPDRNRDDLLKSALTGAAGDHQLG